MKKFTKILLIGCLLVTVSCNNWLDVDPKSQVKDKDLFASEMGFKEALSGVYSLMTKEGLYGKELTFGWLVYWDKSGRLFPIIMRMTRSMILRMRHRRYGLIRYGLACIMR